MTYLESQFLNFHARNPKVYELFQLFATQAILAGRKVLSAGLIFERIRWETMVITTDPDFKLNNNHRAYYARLWMDDHPDADGTFRTRQVRGR